MRIPDVVFLRSLAIRNVADCPRPNIAAKTTLTRDNSFIEKEVPAKAPDGLPGRAAREFRGRPRQ